MSARVAELVGTKQIPPRGQTMWGPEKPKSRSLRRAVRVDPG